MAARGQPDISDSIDRRLLFVLTVATGAAVANLYYAQPLLPAIADDFDVGSGTTGLIVTVSQLGFASAIALLLPLGDILDRRRLLPLIVTATSVALVGMAVAPSIGALIAVAALVGAGAAVAQMLIPLAAELSTDTDRGRVVGTLMTGLLCGILLARTIAGAVAEAGGWRAVYVAAGVVMLVIAAILRRELPAESHRDHLPYRALLRSTLRLLTTEPILRLRCLYGAFAFGCFSVLWTSVAFLLKGDPYNYSDAIIGLFGLVGAAGALTVNGAGRLADRGHNRVATLAFAVTMAVSFGILALGKTSVIALIVGILILDVGCNGLHVLNQHTNYSLPNAAATRSRLNSVYMTSFFLGGSFGSAASAWAYSHHGWTGTCALGAGLGVAAVLLWLVRGAGGVVSGPQGT